MTARIIWEFIQKVNYKIYINISDFSEDFIIEFEEYLDWTNIFLKQKIENK